MGMRAEPRFEAQGSLSLLSGAVSVGRAGTGKLGWREAEPVAAGGSVKQGFPSLHQPACEAEAFLQQCRGGMR